MTLRLLLVRHGLSSFNQEKRLQGRNDHSTLTSIGIEQAIKTGKSLSSLKIDYVYSSPLQRAADTTSNILNQFPYQVEPIFDEELLEIDLGEWSGLTIEEAQKKFPNEYKKWKQHPEKISIKRNDGSEFNPIKELRAQTKGFLSKLIANHSPKEDSTILIVAHNAILRCLILELLDHHHNGFRRIQLDNASISVINLDHRLAKNNIQIECLNNISHLGRKIPPKKKDGRIILVRHGETNWNLEGRFQGQIDIPLNENGIKQAEAARIFLNSIKIDKAYSSSLQRPKQTAEKILESYTNIKIKLENQLIEIGHGLWEGKLEKEISEEWTELLQAWKNNPEAVKMPSGESIKDVWKRSIKCWNEISKSIKSTETVLVVAHDAVNKTILCHLLGLEYSDIWKIKQGNGGITVIDLHSDDENSDIVTCLNLTSHLGGLLDQSTAGAL